MWELFKYEEYIELNPDISHLDEFHAKNHWNTIGYKEMRLCNKRQLYVISEFGQEILLHACYYYYLYTRGLFFQNKIYTYKGMRDIYYFLDPANVIEREETRTWTPPDERPFLVNRTEHQQWFDKRFWEPIPYKLYFQNIRFNYETPLLVIQNKYNSEWDGPPINFFSLPVLQTIFDRLQNQYTIVYIRHSVESIQTCGSIISVDHNDLVEGLCDFACIREKYPNVRIFDDLVVEHGMGYNRTKLELFASCDNYISVQGGNAHLISFFYKKLLLLHRKGKEMENGAYKGWYLETSNLQKELKVVENEPDLIESLSMF